MRQYTPLWHAIRDATDKSVTLRIPINSQGRVIQAIRKEKCRDSEFRYQCELRDVRYKVKDKVESSDPELLTLYLSDGTELAFLGG